VASIGDVINVVTCVTLWCHTHDITIFKVVAFGN